MNTNADLLQWFMCKNVTNTNLNNIFYEKKFRSKHFLHSQHWVVDVDSTTLPNWILLTRRFLFFMTMPKTGPRCLTVNSRVLRSLACAKFQIEPNYSELKHPGMWIMFTSAHELPVTSQWIDKAVANNCQDSPQPPYRCKLRGATTSRTYNCRG